MTPTEYRALRKVHRATGDVDLGRLLLAYELKRRPSSPGEVVQLRLTCVEVYCDAFEARLTVAECIKRANATTASGRGRGFHLHERCKVCALREIHRAMAPGFAPPPFRPFSIQRQATQRAARQKLWKTGALEPVRTIDSPHGEE